MGLFLFIFLFHLFINLDFTLKFQTFDLIFFNFSFYTFYELKIWKDIKLRLDRRRQSTCGRVTANHQARRREEDNLAVVFMGIVGMFLACHALRIFLSLHEMTIIRDAMKCHNLERRGFPVWAEITTTFRQVLTKHPHALNR